MSESPSLTLLHLSDLHFGQDRGEATARFDQQLVIQALLQDIRAQVKQGLQPDAVLITGDIAFSGKPEEYTQAEAWLKQVCEATGVTPAQLLLVPGNHDVDRKRVLEKKTALQIHRQLRQSPLELDYYLREVDELQLTLWPKLAAYIDFFARLGGPILSPAQPFWRHTLTTRFGNPVVVLGLNSCLLSFDGDDAPNNLALGLGQLEPAFRNIPDDALVLVLAHHPPEWLVDGVPGGGSRPEHALTTFLQKHPHILFVGHVHQQGGLASHPFHLGGLLRFVAGAGHEAAHEGGRHAYAWVRVHGEGIDFYPRMWNADRQRFQPESNRFELEKGEEYTRIKRTKLADPLEVWLERAAPLSSSRAAPASTTPPGRFLLPSDLIKRQDRVLVVDGFGSLAASPAVQSWRALVESAVVFDLSQKPELKTSDLYGDGLSWTDLIQHCRTVVEESLKEVTGTLHVFAQGHFGLVMLLARLLDERGPSIPRVYYQLDTETKEWVAYKPLASQGGSFFRVELEHGPHDVLLSRVVLLSIEFREAKQQELDTIRSIHKVQRTLRLKANRFIQTPEDLNAAHAELRDALEQLRRSSFESQQLHILTSAPNALMMLLADTLRTSVFPSAVIHHYDPRSGYRPILDLVRAQPYWLVPTTICLSHIDLRGIKRFRECVLFLPPRPGWYVLAGINGSGKSSLLQAIALGLAGKTAADAIFGGQEGLAQSWISAAADGGSVTVVYRYHHAGFKADVDWTRATSWWVREKTFVSEGLPTPTLSRQRQSPPRGTSVVPGSNHAVESFGASGMLGGKEEATQGATWNRDQLFLVGYGPFRRTTGQSDDAQKGMRSEVGNILGLFRDDVSLVDAVEWLKRQDYREKSQGAEPRRGWSESKSLTSWTLELLNDGLFPSGSGAGGEPSDTVAPGQPLRLIEITPDGLVADVEVSPGHHQRLLVQHLSDGYRTALALTLDLFRRIVEHCEAHRAGEAVFERVEEGEAHLRIRCPGIVLIDEVDAHLHIAWQQQLGFWLKSHFPDLQFIVTTHSPFVCQAAEEDGLFRIRPPYEPGDSLVLMTGDDRNALLRGEINEAAMSSLFGLETTRSKRAEADRAQVAALEVRVQRRKASPEEVQELTHLAAGLPKLEREMLEGLLSRRRGQS